MGGRRWSSKERGGTPSLRYDSGQKYDITSGLGQSSRGASTEDRNISILGIDYPRIYLLSRRKSVHVCIPLCTHVYTIVYTRVHTFALSMFALGLSLVQFSGLTPRHSRDMAKRLPLGMKCPPEKSQRVRNTQRAHASAQLYDCRNGEKYRILCCRYGKEYRWSSTVNIMYTMECDY